MPVFRKGRITPRRERRLETGVYTKGGRRVYGKKKNWPVNDTPFATIKNQFSVVFKPLGEHGSFIEERAREKGRPAVVLDWGCGSGVAAGGLAKEYGGKVRVYGYSKDSYKEWRDIGGVKFIQSPKEDLLRYLKDGSIDLVYSWQGLNNIAGNGRMERHLKQLLPKLSQGGKIVFTGSGTNYFLDELNRQFRGMAIASRHGNALVITKL